LIDLVRRRPIDYGQDAAHWTFKLFNYYLLETEGPQRWLTAGAHGPWPVGRWGQSATATRSDRGPQTSADNNAAT